MRRIITIYLLFLGTFMAIAQEQGNITLHWTEKKQMSYGEFSVMVPQFDAENFIFNNYSKTLQYTATIKLTSQINETAFQISNLVFEPIQESELGDISTKKNSFVI